GSVELSIPYESIEKELSKLLLNKNSILLLKKNITIDMLFEKQKDAFIPSSISDDFVIENTKTSSLSAKAQDSAIVQKINSLLQKETDLPQKLKEGTNFTLLMLDGQQGYAASFHAIEDTSHQLAAYALNYGELPELVLIEKKYFYQFIFASVTTVLLIITFFILLRQRKRILLEKMQFETIITKTTNGIILLNSKGLITFINQAACKMLGYQAEELIGVMAHSHIHVHNTSQKDENCRIMDSIIFQRTYIAEEILKMKSGEHLMVHLTSAPFVLNTKHTGTVIIFRDITQEKHDQALIQHLAYYDSLTDLPNRKLLLDRLNYTITINSRSLEYSGLLFIDIDNFKTLNDTLGHDMGDILLINVAQRLKDTVRISDTVSRFGGDEFVLLITKLGTDEHSAKEELRKLSQKLLHAISQKYDLQIEQNSTAYHCTASIGGTLFNDHSRTVDEILKDADDAMYAVKKNGKNAISIL
ncbi:MAG: sensor domain-containing diguanylate cyclase, partial [Sulfurospirillaceae bacterium]|nr:sensor domain-containing diguanylate cyclase [Sulfurospirillaceae bacterium]